ncbi:hypothetical protein [Occultella kanbiaonis]|uniref:hypothetical protein n=1 Tax=Occultella kanbiaonis TaxID=2675754 RepID=UPI0013D690C9|nr:hypothetical protein [Occultella kanbiaonis]
MTEQPPTPAVSAHVLLSSVPTDMGEVLSSIQPGMGDPLAGAPLLPSFEMRVNGADLTIGAFGAPISDPRLQADLANSPLRQTLTQPVADHRASISLGVNPPQDFAASLDTWATVVAYLLDRDDAVAVWLPYQQHVTTDVMFMGWAERDMAVNLTGVHAMWLDGDQTASVAFTSGLAALGGRELQLRGERGPAAAHALLQAGTAAELNQRRIPQPGGTIVVEQTPYLLVEGTGAVDGRPVLDLVAQLPGQQAAEKPKKRRWPFG